MFNAPTLRCAAAETEPGGPTRATARRPADARWDLRVLDALPAGVVVLNGLGVVEGCNPAARELFGEDPRGAVWREVAARVFRPRPDDGTDVSLAGGRRVQVSTGSLGRGPGQVLLLQDVTETRLLQARLGQLERLSALGEMVAALAHQVRTPLASALLYAGVLARGATGATAGYAGRLLGVLRHLDGLVRDLLLFARRGSFELEEVSLGQLTGWVGEHLGGRVAERGARLVLTGEAGDAVVQGSRQALTGVLANLVENALEAGAREVRVTSGRHGPGRVWVEVADDGPGVPVELRERVFEPFFTTRPSGSGLGLAVVRAVAQAHGGRVELHEGPGGRFRVELPVR
jgi:two-component system sensor histidine kinase FlrB